MIEHDLTGHRPDAEQSSRLRQVEREPGHLPVGPDNRRHEVRSRRLGRRLAARMMPTFESLSGVHRSQMVQFSDLNSTTRAC
jgi:hypothetical protein